MENWANVPIFGFFVKFIQEVMDVEKRTFPAKIEHWDAVAEFLEQQLEDGSWSAKATYEILVSAEEIFTNITSYAYENEDGAVEVIFENFEEEHEIRISFKDQGIPYNPLERPDPSFDIPFEERRIGGLGIYMVKKFMDYVEYRHEDGSNIFMIGKKW